MKYTMYVDMVEGYTQKDYKYVLNVVNQKIEVFMKGRTEKIEVELRVRNTIDKESVSIFMGHHVPVSVARSPHGHKTAMDQFFVETQPKMVQVEMMVLETPDQVLEADFLVLIDAFSAAQPILPQKVKQTSERVVRG